MFHPEVVHTPDGAQAHRQFRAQGRRPEERLDDGGVSRRGARGDPRAGRQGQGDLRPFRRRRFRRRRRAHPRGDRRPAHLRLRRSRPDARRARARRSCGCSATITTSRSSMCDAAELFLGALERRRGSRGEAQDDRPAVHRRLRGARRRRSPPTGAARSSSWRRARSIPT